MASVLASSSPSLPPLHRSHLQLRIDLFLFHALDPHIAQIGDDETIRRTHTVDVHEFEVIIGVVE